MAYEVSVIDEAPRRLIGVAREAVLSRFSEVLMPAFDTVWAHIRANDVGDLGHNVIYYRSIDPLPGNDMRFDCVIGVQVHGEAPLAGEIAPHEIAACSAATVAYFGDYSGLHAAHDAIHHWCAANGRSFGRNWEVYGDWEDDPAKRRTDVYYELT